MRVPADVGYACTVHVVLLIFRFDGSVIAGFYILLFVCVFGPVFS